MQRDEQALLQAHRARERAQHLLDNLEEMRRSNQVPSDTHELLHQEYTASLDAATAEMARVRKGLERRLSDTRQESAETRQELERLGNRYKYGDLARNVYDKAARSLESHLSALDAQCPQLQALLDAESSFHVDEIVSGRGASHGVATRRPASPGVAGGGHSRLHLRPLLVSAAVVAVALVGIRSWPSIQALLPATGNEAVRHITLNTGERVDVTSGPLSEAGDTLSVSGTGTPVDGLSIELPPGAYDMPVEFTVGYSPVEGIDVEEGVQAISPLIHVDADTDEYGDEAVAVRIPAEVPEGHFAMAFVYDEEDGSLHPVPTLDEDEGELTALSPHFCPVVLLSAPYDRFLSESVKQPEKLKAIKLTTGFTPGRDTWNLANAGSAVAPGGYCKGMSLTSLYHYLVEGPITGQPLWKDEYANGLPEGMGTPGFWQDDRWAIELCSAANRLGTTREAGSVMDGIAARVNKLTPERRLKNLERQFYMTAFALYVTKAPQLLDVHESASNSGHSLLCYGVDGTALSIADPNYPDRKNITIQFADGKLGPYTSAQSVQDIKAGKFKTYDRVFYEGDISFFNVRALEQMWTSYEAGSINAGLPPYTIKAIELNEQGTTLRAYELDRQLSNSSATKKMRFELAAGFEGRLTVYRYGQPPQAVSGNEMTLDDGDNYIGFLVEERKNNYWEWAGFDWVHIYRGPEQAGIPRSYYCELTVEFNGTFKDKGSGEEEQRRDSVEVAAFGRYDGAAFTADWVDEYPGLTETGHIVVDLDETNMYVTRFEFTTEWDADDGSLERYGAVGPGTRCVLGFDETHFHCESDEDVAAESVQVTWLQNPPVADSGLYYYDLISASDFHIVIDLIQQEASPGTGVPIG